ncbi:hypothetical protein FQA47_005172 [Oryzias melastigma]|uniref:Uncharacterized protein n=1 Tax=Oryzias melastigma TaxID=30732 RepID=A0A834F716_ORYME|nr:hypothetical protein FQA47_005172 [Oryzias melastigma]
MSSFVSGSLSSLMVEVFRFTEIILKHLSAEEEEGIRLWAGRSYRLVSDAAAAAAGAAGFLLSVRTEFQFLLFSHTFVISRSSSARLFTAAEPTEAAEGVEAGPPGEDEGTSPDAEKKKKKKRVVEDKRADVAERHEELQVLLLDVERSSSIGPEAEHLHTSAERAEFPFASLSSAVIYLPARSALRREDEERRDEAPCSSGHDDTLTIRGAGGTALTEPMKAGRRETGRDTAESP